MTSRFPSPSYSLRIPTEDLCPDSPFLQEPPAPPRNTPQYRPPHPVERPRKNGRQDEGGQKKRRKIKEQKMQENVERTEKSSSTRCCSLLPIAEEEDEEGRVPDSDAPGDKNKWPPQASLPLSKRPYKGETGFSAKRMKATHVEVKRMGVEAERLGPFNTKIEADSEAEELDCSTLEGMMESLKINKEKRMEGLDTYVEKTVKMRRPALVKVAHS